MGVGKVGLARKWFLGNRSRDRLWENELINNSLAFVFQVKQTARPTMKKKLQPSHFTSDAVEIKTDSTTTALSASAAGLEMSGKVKATSGEIGGLTIGSDKVHVGTGTHGNSNTAFYVDDSGKFSLKDKLKNQPL